MPYDIHLELREQYLGMLIPQHKCRSKDNLKSFPSSVSVWGGVSQEFNGVVRCVSSYFYMLSLLTRPNMFIFENYSI